MASSPNSVAATSDIDAPSSPMAIMDGQSFPFGVPADAQTSPDLADKYAKSSSISSRVKAAAKELAAQQLGVTGKIRHLKKEDGEPLWRRDIQYDYLRAIFDDDQAVFTNSYDEAMPKQRFADLYIDTMARSSKTSKVLRDKLLSDREAAKSMAMSSLTFAFEGTLLERWNERKKLTIPSAHAVFPEMRAQLRTYHAIPSLQARQDPHAYKQLQDAPRLKSILKAGIEDRDEPDALEKMRKMTVPRTNPVNLIFVVCQSAAKIAELHFPSDQEFHDLIMKTNYSSESRAMAFLWLMWFYLESDFTQEGCEENPFGSGVDYGKHVANQGVPRLLDLNGKEDALENLDTPDELEFGIRQQQMRAKIIEADQQLLERDNKRPRGKNPVDNVETGPAILPRMRPPKNESDIDSTRSTPPPRVLAKAGNSAIARQGGSLKHQLWEASSPAGQPGSQPVEVLAARKARPPTAHQIAVERSRGQQVDHILNRRLRKHHHQSKRLRRHEGAIYRAWKRMRQTDDPLYDSDGDGCVQRSLFSRGDTVSPLFRESGLGGLCLLATEPDDFGEEVSAYAAALRRAQRRLDRSDGVEGPAHGERASARRLDRASERIYDEHRDLDDLEGDMDAINADEADLSVLQDDGAEARAGSEAGEDPMDADLYDIGRAELVTADVGSDMD